MPLVELDARRLILVRVPALKTAAAVLEHIVETHGDDVKYMMAASSDDCVDFLDSLVAGIQAKHVRRVSTAQSMALREIEPTESAEDACSRAIETRDYILRGTLDGAASLLITHESIIELILLRASELEPDFESFRGGAESVPAVSVLDFGVGSYPWMVADEKPIMQPQWDLNDEC